MTTVKSTSDKKSATFAQSYAREEIEREGSKTVRYAVPAQQEAVDPYCFPELSIRCSLWTWPVKVAVVGQDQDPR